MARFLVVCLVLALVGCGSGARLSGLQGEVSLGGQPVASGVISFVPVQEGANVGVGTPILHGKYELSAERGLRPGKYRVEIHWPRPTGRTTIDEQTKEPLVETMEAIPAKYNAQSELTVEITSGSAKHNFELLP